MNLEEEAHCYRRGGYSLVHRYLRGMVVELFWSETGYACVVLEIGVVFKRNYFPITSGKLKLFLNVYGETESIIPG